MENQTRFDLNAAMESWRNELAAQPNLTQETRRELETHLNDTVSELRQRGLDDEEAFWLAHRRTGQPEQLGAEFVKANPDEAWRERIFWIALACLMIELWRTALQAGVGVIPLKRNNILVFLIYYIIFYVPIIWISIYLVKGKMSRFKLSHTLFSSRRSVIVVAAVVGALFMLFNYIQTSRYTHMSGSYITVFMLPALINVSVLIALISWLIPQKRTNLKHS
jgi:hypothetical protein